MGLALAAAAAAPAAVGCAGGSNDVFATCELEVALDATTAVPGEVITASGGPFVDERLRVGEPERELLVSVGGTDAPIEEAASEDAGACESCQVCRSEARCPQCGTCDGRRLEPDRREECFGGLNPDDAGVCGACTQRVRFVVPDLEPGSYGVTILSPFGANTPVLLDVVAP